MYLIGPCSAKRIVNGMSELFDRNSHSGILTDDLRKSMLDA